MRFLKDHPALVGRSITSEWRKCVTYRALLIAEKAARYSRQVQQWRRACAFAIKEKREAEARAVPWKNPPKGQKTQRPLTPFEFERSLRVTPPYPLNYLVQ